jgi:hypothetical protein
MVDSATLLEAEAEALEEMYVVREVYTSEGELRRITVKLGNSDMKNAYNRVWGCSCHGRHNDAPKLENVWMFHRYQDT